MQSHNLGCLLIVFAVLTGSCGDGGRPTGTQTPASPPNLGLDAAGGPTAGGAQLFCKADHVWHCDSAGECNAMAPEREWSAWKVDTVKGRYALCARHGRECVDWVTYLGKEYEGILVFTNPGNHPETFKIERNSGKFVAVRLSGMFNASNVNIVSRTGSCVELAK